MNLFHLSNEELEALVSFITPNGKVYLYSQIDELNENQLTYKGSVYGLTNEQYQVIKQGIVKYETTKLHMTSNEFEKLLTDKIENTLSKHYKQRINDTIKPLGDQISELYTDFVQLRKGAEMANEEADKTISNLTKYAKKIDNFINSTDFSTINKSLSDKVNELDSIKEDVKTRLAPITHEAGQILTNLKKIIS